MWHFYVKKKFMKNNRNGKIIEFTNLVIGIIAEWGVAWLVFVGFFTLRVQEKLWLFLLVSGEKWLELYVTCSTFIHFIGCLFHFLSGFLFSYHAWITISRARVIKAMIWGVPLGVEGASPVRACRQGPLEVMLKPGR